MDSSDPPDNPPIASERGPTLKARAYQGIAWSLTGAWTGQAIRFAVSVILTRLLIPEHFAVMAIVHTVLMGVEMFADMGITPSIVQNDRGDEEAFLHTAWTIQTIRGFVLWGIILVLAVPVSMVYQQPILAWLLAVTGVNAVLRGLQSTSMATMSRHLRLRERMALTLVSQILAALAMIGWAWVSPSPWAFVAGTLVDGAALAALSHWPRFSIRHRFRLEPSAKKELIRFGRWILLSTALTYLANQWDRLLLPRMLPLATFGVLTIALNISAIPLAVLGNVFDNVLFPVLSKMKHLPRPELRAQILKARRWPAIGLQALVALGVACADWAVKLVYPKEYWAAAWMVPMLTLGLSITTLSRITGPILLALGKPSFHMAGNAARLVFFLVALPLTTWRFGVWGAVLTITLAELPAYSIKMYFLAKERVSTLRSDLSLLFFCASLVAATQLLRVALGLGPSLSVSP